MNQLSSFFRLLTASAACGAALLQAQITESPETVKPGHFLLEVDALSIATNLHDSAGGTYSAVAVATTFLTAGLTSDIDVQVGADVFLS